MFNQHAFFGSKLWWFNITPISLQKVYLILQTIHPSLQREKLIKHKQKHLKEILKAPTPPLPENNKHNTTKKKVHVHWYYLSFQAIIMCMHTLHDHFQERKKHVLNGCTSSAHVNVSCSTILIWLSRHIHVHIYVHTLTYTHY